jgi:hypothetical protein
MNTKEIDEKIFIIEQKIISENDNKIFSITVIKDLSAFRETSFIHIGGNYKIAIQFIGESKFVRIWLLKNDLSLGFLRHKTIKKIKLNLNQETEIVNFINSYKKEIILRDIF